MCLYLCSSPPLYIATVGLPRGDHYSYRQFAHCMFSPQQPGYVFKSYILPEGEKKLFVNMCMSDIIDPSSVVGRIKTSDGKIGEDWNIPYSLTPPRDDHDKGAVSVRDTVILSMVGDH